MKITRKKYLVFIVLTLIVTVVTVFYHRRLTNLILTTQITANECIIWQGDLAENYTLSKEETAEILNIMDKTFVRFAGFNNGIILNKDEHTYNLLLLNRSSEELTELGSFTFDENGYVYAGKFKYKLISQDEILNIIKTNVNK